jgi:2-dehydro-3-deoxyglucarate aldolase
MRRSRAIQELRQKLQQGSYSIGSWMQISNSSVAEIMGQSGYDWVAVDLEHGSFSTHQLPDLFRALELGMTIPLARIAQGHPKDCKQALDAGACGVIVPMIESITQLEQVRDACCWPPSGKRGVGFSRANLFGQFFDQYAEEAQAPILVAMIENIDAIDKLESILQVQGLDAVMIGPYDLSASMGLTAKFEHPDFQQAMNFIRTLANKTNIPCGVHVVSPSEKELQQRLDEGYRFLAYSIDAVFLRDASTLKQKDNHEKHW